MTTAPKLPPLTARARGLSPSEQHSLPAIVKDMVRPYLVPLFRVAWPGTQPLAAGTGVLATLLGHDFIVTAGHCVDPATDDLFLVGVNDRFVELRAVATAVLEDARGIADAAAFILRSEQVSQICAPMQFLNLDQPLLSTACDAAPGYECCFVLGFPSARYVVDNERKAIAVQPISVLGRELPSSEATQIVFGAATTTPLPHLDGISGSGFWRVRGMSQSARTYGSTCEIELVGTQTDHKAGAQTIIGTRLAVLREALRYQILCGAIDAALIAQ